MAAVLKERWDPRSSTRLYLSVLLVGSVMGLWGGYLWPEYAIFRGQAAGVLAPMLAFGVAAAMWLLLASRPWVRRWPLLFLGVLAVAWVVNLIDFRIHNDAFTYPALVFLPILLMVLIKPPTLTEGASALVSLAWAITIVLVSTRLLEMAGVLSQKAQPEGVITFDKEYYWLPLNSALGIEGRWPGPFGHNGFTAMMGAFVIVIAIAFWTRSSWVFLAVGSFTLLVTSGRASAGAAAAGIVLFTMFTTRGWVGRVSRKWRLIFGVVALGAGVLVLFSGKSGLTGRQYIWPAFWDLWLTSPVLGVGGSGIAVSGGVTGHFLHAHSLYLDLLARNGLVSFIPVMAALGIGLGITIAAALRGQPGPLALLAAYLITGVTEPRNDWLHPSTYVLMIVVAVVSAGSVLGSGSPPRAIAETPAPDDGTRLDGSTNVDASAESETR